MNIPKFSVQNGVLLSIVMATILILGGLSLLRLPQEQFSEVPFYWVNVTVPYPGASAEDVERSVTIKVERDMQGLPFLKEIQSVTAEGISVVRVQFDDGIDDDEFSRLYQDVRTRFSRVDLPAGTLPAVVDDFSSNDFLPVVEVAVYGDVPYEDLYRASRVLEDRFASLPSLSSVGTAGRRDRRIAVEARRDKLESRGIALSELVRAVQQRNVSVPAGVLETENREYLLRTLAELRGTEDLASIVLRRSDRAGSVVRLSDVASISQEHKVQGESARFNGKSAIFLSLAKVPRGNAVGLIERARAAAAAAADELPAGVSYAFVNDSTVQIRDSISVLVSNALQGLVLLTVILLVFLGLRNALITALGIPVTFAATFLILDMLGETLNSNTLFGLVLVLGMIVDHAIVITENTFRLRKLGVGLEEAAVEGTSQVAWPIVSSTLTTVAAFLPLMILPGTIGKFLRVIPLTVVIALSVSVLEAIFFTPSHLAEWPGGNRRTDKPDIFDRIGPGLEKAVRFLYQRRVPGLILFTLLLAGIFSTIPRLRQDLFSAEDFSLFYIEMEMPGGTNRSRTEAAVAAYESLILPRKGDGEVVNVLSTIGGSKGSTAKITVDLTEVKEGRKRPIAVIMEEVKAATADISGPERVIFRKAQSGPPVSPPVGFRLRGDDRRALAEAAALIEERLSGYGELFNITDTIESGTSELRVRVDEERAAALGLSTASVGSYIRGSYDGLPAGSVFFVNEEIDVVVRFAQAENSSSVDRLRELKFPTPDGRLVPFSAVAALQELPADSSIKRVDGKREVGISADAYDKKIVPGVNKDIRAYFAAELAPRYPGLSLVVGGEFSELADLLIQILRVLLLGLFLIYAVLGAQFKSYSQPLLILLSVPMAFGGVVVYLLLSGTPFSTTVLYATVALAGISVNDSIVLIDFINDRRKAGASAREAVVSAVLVRFRPIFLTSITTIAGLLPTALGFGGYSQVWSPMAGTIIFGLVSSTVTTVTVIPLLYGLLYDREKGKKRGWGSASKGAADTAALELAKV